MGFQRHGSPRFCVQQGRPSASHWLGSLSLSIPDGTGSVVWTKFPNRVIYRTHRRFIGPITGVTDHASDRRNPANRGIFRSREMAGGRPIMLFNYLIGISSHATKADKSAV